MELRPYQTEALDAVKAGYEAGNLNQLLVLSTGAGKTYTSARIKEHLGLRGPVLVLAHLDTLLDQFERTWRALFPGNRIGFEQGPRSLEPGEDYDLVLASMQTLGGRRFDKIKGMKFSLVICDEVHHSPSNSHQKVLDSLGLLPESRTSSALLVGLTATPTRADKKDLRKTYPHLAYEYTLWDALEQGYWCPVHCRRILTGTDLTDLELRSNGEFKAEDLDERLIDNPRHSLLESAWRESGGRNGRTVVFCSSRQHARSLTEYFREHGTTNTQYVDGESENREGILRRFSEGPAPSVLVNVRLVSEGVDVPGITHVLFASPIGSLIGMTQGVGRGTRLAPGKASLQVLYAVDDVPKAAKLASPASLLGLPAGLDLEGESLLTCRDILRDIVSESPVSLQALIEAGRIPDTLSELRRMVDELPLYVPTDLSGALKGLTRLAWSVSDGEALLAGDPDSAEHYLLRVPAPLRKREGEVHDQRTITLDLVGDTWRCREWGPPPAKAALQARLRALKESVDGEQQAWRKQQAYLSMRRLREEERAIPDVLFQDVRFSTDLKTSVRRADAYVARAMPQALKVIALDAPWRTDPPTPGQTRFAKRLGIPLPDGITKGALTMLIDHQLRRQASKK